MEINYLNLPKSFKRFNASFAEKNIIRQKENMDSNHNFILGLPWCKITNIIFKVLYRSKIIYNKNTMLSQFHFTYFNQHSYNWNIYISQIFVKRFSKNENNKSKKYVLPNKKTTTSSDWCSCYIVSPDG